MSGQRHAQGGEGEISPLERHRHTLRFAPQQLRQPHVLEWVQPHEDAFMAAKRFTYWTADCTLPGAEIWHGATLQPIDQLVRPEGAPRSSTSMCMPGGRRWSEWSRARGQGIGRFQRINPM